MICTRCAGGMSHERFQDLLDNEGKYRFVGWRCLNCGAIQDQVIMANRWSQAKPIVRGGAG